jgi:thymidylate kinase
MPRRSYRVVSCEGGDQCGKADAILGFLKRFQERGVSITYSSFPIYASPFGTVIRKFLKNGLDDFNFPPMEELKIKMALYALDRLQFLDVVLSNPEYKKTLILLDRSSFSNAVTLAYGIVNIKNFRRKEDMNSFLRYAFWVDGLMIRKLGLKNCVVQMVSEDNTWENVRGEKQDINENVDVQRITEETYRMYQEKVGDGWRRIVTKTKDGWVDREEIFQNIYDFVVERYGEFNLEVFPKKLVINIEEILENSYPSAVVNKEDIKKYLEALSSNDKDSMHEYGIKIGEQIGISTKEFILRDKEVQEMFVKIFRRKSDADILDVVEKYLGKGFADKITESINKWTNEK